MTRLRRWLQARVERQTRTYLATTGSVSPSNVRLIPGFDVCRTVGCPALPTSGLHCDEHDTRRAR